MEVTPANALLQLMADRCSPAHNLQRRMEGICWHAAAQTGQAGPSSRSSSRLSRLPAA